jgi:hypothetical protein
MINSVICALANQLLLYFLWDSQFSFEKKKKKYTRVKNKDIKNV